MEATEDKTGPIPTQAPSFPSIDCQVEAITPAERKLRFVYHRDQEPAELTVNGLTVGDVFHLRCTGAAFDLDPAQVKILWPQEEKEVVKKAALQIVGVESNTASEVVLQAQSFFSGSQKWSFVLDAGSKQYSVKDLAIQQTRLLDSFPKAYQDQKQAALVDQADSGLQGMMQSQQPQPYPPLIRAEMPYSLWFWLGLAAFFVAMLAAFLALNIRKNRKRREQLRWQQSKSPIGSHKDFHQTVRRLERAWYSKEYSSSEALQVLYADLRLFFFREYRIDNQEESLKPLLNFFKRSRTVKASRLRRFEVFLEELAKQAQTEQEPSAEQVKDYLRRAREWVDQFYIRGGL